MSLAALATVFGVVFIAELPDKTALASLILGSRFRPSFVFAGVAAAFAVHTVLAVTAGGLLALLPHRWVDVIVAILFAGGAVVLLRGRHDEDAHLADGDRRGFWRVAGMSFMVIFVAEFGDLTQVLIASLSAHYHDPVPVGAAAALGLWAVAALAIVGGRGLLRVISLTWIARAAAAVMLVLAGVSLADAVG